jgi:hypothetical protein
VRARSGRWRRVGVELKQCSSESGSWSMPHPSRARRSDGSQVGDVRATDRPRPSAHVRRGARVQLELLLKDFAPLRRLRRRTGVPSGGPRAGPHGQLLMGTRGTTSARCATARGKPRRPCAGAPGTARRTRPARSRARREPHPRRGPTTRICSHGGCPSGIRCPRSADRRLREQAELEPAGAVERRVIRRGDRAVASTTTER